MGAGDRDPRRRVSRRTRKREKRPGGLAEGPAEEGGSANNSRPGGPGQSLPLFCHQSQANLILQMRLAYEHR